MIESQIVDQFLIREPLAQGSYGQCFRTEHISSGKTYALRVLGNEYSQRDLESAKILLDVKEAEDCSFPSVCQCGIWHGSHYIATPFAFGEDLRTWVHQKGPMEISQGLVCIIKTLDCFLAMATDSVGHGLLRPSKLVLTSSRTIGIRDLPLAKLFQHRLPRTWQSPRTIPIQHAAYIAPEILLDGAQPGFRSDIYALGCILYFLLIGKTIHRCSDTDSLLRCHVDKFVPSLAKSRSNIPGDLEACFRKMVASNPSERFASYQHCHATLKAIIVAMSRELESIDQLHSATKPNQVHGRRQHANKKNAATQNRKLTKSIRIWIALGAIFAVIFIALSFFAMNEVDDESPRGIQTVNAEDSFQLP